MKLYLKDGVLRPRVRPYTAIVEKDHNVIKKVTVTFEEICHIITKENYSYCNQRSKTFAKM